MKKNMYLNLTLIFLFACLIAGTTFAQNITIEDAANGHGYLENTTGYIGIRPANTVHGLILRDHTGASVEWSGLRHINNGNSDRLEFAVRGNNYGKSLVLMQNNRVGIGTTNPQQKLHVAGHMRLSGNGSTYAFIQNTTGFIGIRSAHPTHGLILRDHTGATTQWSGLRHIDNGSNDRLEFGLSSYLNYGKSLVLTQNNRVGIGTTTPENKLDVNGTIRAKEIKVEEGWGDYVFYDDYQLPTLEDEEKHIEENGHLLGFESAEDMAGEIQLGDVSKRQQVKIEEVILHLIDIKKEVVRLNGKIAELEEENEQLKEQMSKK